MEGRRKEIILLVLAVAALGIALYTFRGNKPAPAPAPAPAATSPGPARADGPETKGEQPAVEAVPGTEGEATAAAADSQRNPFSTPGGVEVAPQVAEGAETTVEPPPTATPGEGGAPITLTGIIDGQQSVAILRQNDQRFFVKVGDLVGEGYRVQSISSQQVVLAGQQGKVILRMGGRQ